jgi:tRNA-splicing ligase RtcB (3'-phosphate/5'-hydroxy nucleic acid ligase)
MKVMSEAKLPVKVWLGQKENGEIDLETGALMQAYNLANLPFAFKHIAIMPDSHEGYGMPIGGVMATNGVVVPNAVGVDIGCGMCACETSLTLGDINKDDVKFIMGMIREQIPVGFNHHKERQTGKPLFTTGNLQFDRCIVDEQADAASYQLGTLGGGNHFIEIQADTWDNIWVMIHSGSRNLGKQVADYYNKLAVELNKRWYSEVPKEWQLAFLPIETIEAKRYMAEMQYCVEFAFANRMHMMRAVEKIFAQVTGATFDDAINIAHNYAAWENHYGQNVLVHRKGATRARAGEIGIIPGSMGTASYIVEGLGNAESFMSCSHGAGRKMGRKDATRRLDLDVEIAHMDARGIIHGIRNTADLDEAPGAYKDIDEVMENQKDLVKINVPLRPLAVIKG